MSSGSFPSGRVKSPPDGASGSCGLSGSSLPSHGARLLVFSGQDSDESDTFRNVTSVKDARSLTKLRFVIVFVRKSDLEIGRFASLYSLNRPQGKTLEEIAQAAGWSLANYANPEVDSYYASYSQSDMDDDEGGADFSYEPWTLLNHPVFIITKALFKCLDEHMGRLLLEVGASCAQTWGVAKSISEASNFLSLAVNSTDLGEDTLARCHYKMGAASLNRLLAKVDSISMPESRDGKERLARIRNIVFDLRQLCLNLAEQSAQARGGGL